MKDYIFNSGSAILSLSIGLNAVSHHATCTAVFATVAAILGFGCSSIRTLGRITWLAWIGLPCILVAGMSYNNLGQMEVDVLNLASVYGYYCRWCGRPSGFCAKDLQSLDL